VDQSQRPQRQLIPLTAVVNSPAGSSPVSVTAARAALSDCGEAAFDVVPGPAGTQNSAGLDPGLGIAALALFDSVLLARRPDLMVDVIAAGSVEQATRGLCGWLVRRVARFGGSR
jgi:hypothetical protein